LGRTSTIRRPLRSWTGWVDSAASPGERLQLVGWSGWAGRARDHGQAERWLWVQADRAVRAFGLDDSLSRRIVAEWVRVRDALGQQR